MTRIGRIIGVAVGGGLLAGFLAGCGGAGTGAPSEEKARLRGLLQRHAALPEGFSAKVRDPWQSPFTTTDRDCQAVLDTATGNPPKRALQAKAAASYQGDVLGETAAVGLASYAGSEAEGHLEALGKSLAACAKLAAAGTGTVFKLADLPVSGVGDEAVARRVRGRLNGYPYAFNLVLVRDGGTLMTLVHTGIRKVDPRRTRELAGALAQ